MRISTGPARISGLVKGFTPLAILLMSGLLFGQAKIVLAEGTSTEAPRPYQVSNGLSGKVTIAGSDTMRPLVMRLAAEFGRLHPDVRFTIEGGGSSAAIREFVMGLSQQRRADKARSGHSGAGRVNLVASSRQLKSSEVKAFTAQHGHEPIGIPIAIDAVVLYVNPQNPIEGLTLEQVAAIFAAGDTKGAPKINTWGELGLRGEWEQRKIQLYGRDKKSGTREFFEEHVLRGRRADADILEQQAPATEILAIARDTNAIGYAGAGFQTNLVSLLALANKPGETFITPTTATVQEGAYPLTRYLYLYVDREPKDGLDPIVKEFLTFITSAAGQNIVTKTGSYPLMDKQLARNAAFLSGASATALSDAKDDPRLAPPTADTGVSGGDTPKED